MDIQYESIQTDEPGVMKVKFLFIQSLILGQKIGEFLNLPEKQLLPQSTIITAGNTSSSSSSSGYTKRTSEDLSTVLTNFHEISSFLSSSPTCECLSKLLHTVDAKPVEPLCYHLVDIEGRKCLEFQDIPENKPNLKFFWGTEFNF